MPKKLNPNSVDYNYSTHKRDESLPYNLRVRIIMYAKSATMFETLDVLKDHSLWQEKNLGHRILQVKRLTTKIKLIIS